MWMEKCTATRKLVGSAPKRDHQAFAKCGRFCGFVLGVLCCTKEKWWPELQDTERRQNDVFPEHRRMQKMSWASELRRLNRAEHAVKCIRLKWKTMAT